MTATPCFWASSKLRLATSRSSAPLRHVVDGGQIMEKRMKNPAMILPQAGQAIQAMISAIHDGGVPRKTLDLVHLRVSQINGCSSCVDGGSRSARKAGESDDRLFAVA